MQPHATTAGEPVPVFKLYGETRDWPTPDLIHCESIAERSRLHDWRIRPHRHRDLTHLLYVRAGEVVVLLDGELVRPSTPLLLVLPEMCVHGFRFSADVQGQVLTLAAPLVQQLREQPGPARAALSTAGAYPLGADAAYVDMLVETLAREYAGAAAGRDLLLRSLMTALVVWAGRQVRARPETAAATADPAERHLRQYTRLIERHFREHRSLEYYAGRIGVSTSHLNAVCRGLAGRSALQILHERLVLEAKRSLVYTILPIRSVSEHLGFSEPAYFTRFFKRHVGLSPRAFRQQGRLQR